jgi:DHA1 family multidrug resistance protein-like MFS transporter
VNDASRALVRLCALAFLAYCSYAICRVPLLPLLARELGATPPMVGLVMGASTLTGVVLKLPAGAWSDILGRRPLLVLGACVFALMPFTYLAITSLGALIAARLVHGSASAIFGPVASASLCDHAPAARRATWLSTYSTVQGMGAAVGPVIAGYLIASRRYDVAFLVAGALAAATPFMAARWPSTPATAAGAAAPRLTQFTQGVTEVVAQPLILITSLAQASQFVLNGTLNAFLPLFARDLIGLSASELGWLFALQTATTLCMRPVMGMLSDRVGRRGQIVSGLAVCSSAVFAVSVATRKPALALAIVIYAVGVAVTTAATSAFITDLSRRTRYGAAHGVFGTIYDVGDAMGPIAAGLLVATMGYARTFQVMATLAMVAAFVFAVISRGTAGASSPTPQN